MRRFVPLLLFVASDLRAQESPRDSLASPDIPSQGTHVRAAPRTVSTWPRALLLHTAAAPAPGEVVVGLADLVVSSVQVGVGRRVSFKAYSLGPLGLPQYAAVVGVEVHPRVGPLDASAGLFVSGSTTPVLGRPSSSLSTTAAVTVHDARGQITARGATSLACDGGRLACGGPFARDGMRLIALGGTAALQDGMGLVGEVLWISEASSSVLTAGAGLRFVSRATAFTVGAVQVPAGHGRRPLLPWMAFEVARTRRR